MKAASSPSLTTREVTSATLADMEKLFEAKGGPKYCWCMAWRATTAELKEANSVNRKRQLAQRVDAETPVGILGYVDSEPVAWCSVAPRRTFRGLVRDGSSHEQVWSITCFYIPRQNRKAGLAKQMLAAAVEHAKRNGSKVVEEQQPLASRSRSSEETKAAHPCAQALSDNWTEIHALTLPYRSMLAPVSTSVEVRVQFCPSAQ
jgi:predicted GNAT family acetyltransferase